MLAERAGVTHPELDAQFQIKSPPVTARTPPAGATRRSKSLISKLIVRLMADPSLAELADPHDLAKGEEVAELDQAELRALVFQLETLRQGEKVANWAEYARNSDFAGLFRRLEEDLFTFEAFKTEEVRTEFVEFWARLLAELHKRVKLLELQGKSAVKI